MSLPIKFHDKEANRVVTVTFTTMPLGLAFNSIDTCTRDSPLLVTKVLPGGHAAELGVQEGFRFLEIAGEGIEGKAMAEISGMMKLGGARVSMTKKSTQNVGLGSVISLQYPDGSYTGYIQQTADNETLGKLVCVLFDNPVVVGGLSYKFRWFAYYPIDQCLKDTKASYPYTFVRSLETLPDNEYPKTEQDYYMNYEDAAGQVLAEAATGGDKGQFKEFMMALRTKGTQAAGDIAIELILKKAASHQDVFDLMGAGTLRTLEITEEAEMMGKTESTMGKTMSELGAKLGSMFTKKK